MKSVHCLSARLHIISNCINMAGKPAQSEVGVPGGQAEADGPRHWEQRGTRFGGATEN